MENDLVNPGERPESEDEPTAAHRVTPMQPDASGSVGNVATVDLNDVIDATQAARLLGVTRQHVIYLLKTRRLAGKRLTATWVTTRQAVLAYTRTRRPPGRPRATNRENLC